MINCITTAEGPDAVDDEDCTWKTTLWKTISLTTWTEYDPKNWLIQPKDV